MFDASSKLPDGVFNGNNHLVGAIHECMAVETPSLLKITAKKLDSKKNYRQKNKNLINLTFFLQSGGFKFIAGRLLLRK